MKAAAFLLLCLSLIAGCKPRSLNDEQVKVEEKLLEISIDSLCRAVETGDILSIQRILSSSLDFTFVCAGKVEEAASPDSAMHLLDVTRARGYRFAFGELRNLSLRVSRTGDMAGVSFDALTDVTLRDTMTTRRLFLTLVMVREAGSWKLTQCTCASPGTLRDHDEARP